MRWPASRNSHWQASGGVRDAADLAALAAVGVAAAVSGKALLEDRIDFEELRPFLPNASSPASTSATARSSRACGSAITASSVTSSSLPRAIATKARTSSCSTTSPRARKAARWIASGSTAWRAVLDIPFCVAGGIRSVADAEAVLECRRREDLRQLPCPGRPGPHRCAGSAIRLAMRGGGHRQPDDSGRLPRLSVHGRSRPLRAIRAATRSNGRARCRSAARARSCSTAWQATACAVATTSSSCSAVRAHLLRAAGRVRRRRRAAALPGGVRERGRRCHARRQRVPQRHDRHPRSEARAASRTASRCGHEP